MHCIYEVKILDGSLQVFDGEAASGVGAAGSGEDEAGDEGTGDEGQGGAAVRPAPNWFTGFLKDPLYYFTTALNFCLLVLLYVGFGLYYCVLNKLGLFISLLFGSVRVCLCNLFYSIISVVFLQNECYYMSNNVVV